jgi:hypothetical protein
MRLAKLEFFMESNAVGKVGVLLFPFNQLWPDGTRIQSNHHLGDADFAVFLVLFGS